MRAIERSGTKDTVIRVVFNSPESDLRIMYRMSWEKKRQIGEMSAGVLEQITKNMKQDVGWDYAKKEKLNLKKMSVRYFEESATIGS